MRQTLRIARTELACLFHSPIAWFILAVFSVLSFRDFYNAYSHTAAIFLQSSLTASVISAGLCAKMVGTLFIYIPLLTMGLMARETSSGSIKLLESSPVRPVQIILGKYLAMMVMGLLMLLVPVVSSIYMAWAVPHFDYALALSGILGIYLLIMVYSAIGLFMSTTTSYQMVAALLSLVTLAALNYVGRLWQEIDFVRSITYWLSIPGRTSNLLDGFVRLDDILYFLLLTALFLGFAVVLLGNRRHSWPLVLRASRYAAVAASVLLLGWLSTQQWLARQWDVTAAQSNTLDDQTLDILSQISEPVAITEYVNLLDQASFKHLPIHSKNTKSAFARFALVKRNLVLKTKYYYRKNAEMRSIFFEGKNEEELRDILSMTYHTSPRLYVSADALDEKDFLASRNYTYCALLETASGKRAVLHDFEDMEAIPSEVELTTVFRSLICPPVKVAFALSEDERPLMGDSEKSMDAFSVQEGARYSLVNRGFEVYQADLNAEIPDSIGILVIADPARPFTAAAEAVIDSFLARGGSLLLLADRASSLSLAPLLDKFGVGLREGIVAMQWENFEPTLVVNSVAEEFLGEYPSVKDKKVSMTTATALELKDTAAFRALPMLRTSKPVMQTSRKAVSEQGFELRPDGKAVTAYALENRVNPSQRVIVVSDADCFSNAELTMFRDGLKTDNYGFIMDCFRFLSGSQYPIDLKTVSYRDVTFRESIMKRRK